VAAPDRAVGSTLEGRYRLEARLAGWGVGEAWRALDAQRQRAPVTVKLLPAPSSRRAERLGALDLLGRRLARLQHPCLLPLVELHTGGAQPFVVYEAWDGVGLGEWLTAARASGELPDARVALGIAERVLAAVGAGHRQRSPGSLVHGALHHDAVRVRVVAGREPEVRVLDVGLSAERDPSAVPALADDGPSEYAAPEHARDAALRNSATDVFAAAVLILRVLAPEAARPRGHRSWAHFVAQREGQVHGAIAALRPDLHPAVWEALASALSLRPEARPVDAEALREMLRAAPWIDARVADEASPIVPVSMPSLQPVAPPVAPLVIADVAASPVPAAAPAPVEPAVERALGPPPVPQGMQLGVAAVLSAGRKSAPTQSAPSLAARGMVSLDDADATRQDFGAPSEEPPTFLDVDVPTMALGAPGGARPGIDRADVAATLPLDEVERTVRAPFHDDASTRVAPLPVPRRAPPSMPHPAPLPRLGAPLGPPQWGGPPAAAGGARATSGPVGGASSLEATAPLSLDGAPPEVVAALGGYAAPVNPASWDSTSNMQPVSYPPAQRATAPGFAPPVSARAAVDPFALVASAGRGDARAWDVPTTPPDRASAPARKTPGALLIALAVLTVALVFLAGALAATWREGGALKSAPTAR
jgi:hypothetical protein